MGVGAGSAPGRHPLARSSRAPARPAIVRAHCPHPPIAAVALLRSPWVTVISTAIGADS